MPETSAGFPIAGEAGSTALFPPELGVDALQPQRPHSSPAGASGHPRG